MRTLLIRRSRSAAASLIVVLAVTFLANCVSAAGATSEHEACCAAMGHDCDQMAAQDNGCCTAETSTVPTGPVVKGLTLAPPTPLLAGMVIHAEPRLLRSLWNRAVDETVGRSPGVPTYVLVSTFRL